MGTMLQKPCDGGIARGKRGRRRVVRQRTRVGTRAWLGRYVDFPCTAMLGLCKAVEGCQTVTRSVLPSLQQTKAVTFTGER